MTVVVELCCLIHCHAHESHVGKLLLQFRIRELPYNRDHGLDVVDVHHEVLKVRDCYHAFREEARVHFLPLDRPRNTVRVRIPVRATVHARSGIELRVWSEHLRLAHLHLSSTKFADKLAELRDRIPSKTWITDIGFPKRILFAVSFILLFLFSL